MNRTDNPFRATDPGVLRILEQVAAGGIRARATDRLAMAHDASHYLLTPEAVVTAADTAQLGRLLRACSANGLPVTFRSGGTSLSGQAVTGSVMIDTRRNFRRIEVLDDGARVRVQPGATVRQVNTRLAPYKTKLGPDPASEIACTIGGVVANNSSGMACGTEYNSYRTLESMTLVLPSGTVIDTAEPDADTRLRTLEPDLHAGLLKLRDRVRSNGQSRRIIEQQFSMKNTMGYGINSFLDHTDPVDILTHLIIGSEGTLAFVADATFRTIANRSHIATGLLIFDDLRSATDALPDLVAAGLATIELMDATSLRVAQLDPLADQVLRGIDVHDHAALLVEYQESTADQLLTRTEGGAQLLQDLSLTLPASLTADPAVRAGLWHIRKGLYATVAGARPSGTTALLEDIAVPVGALADTCTALTGLFATHGYDESVIFGHAKDGNIHFLLNERFDHPGMLDRYIAFTEDLVTLVLGRNGTLKAEHGTGRIMAPFVRRQYGDELYEVMQQVKLLCDPRSVLNPGVLLDENPRAHVSNLKTAPTVEVEVDRCVECGYCETVCPSKDLTLTPRQRIVLRRELAAAEAVGDHALVGELATEYGYDGIDTCAVDGLCQTACPVLIDTGQLVKRLRADRHSKAEQAVWRQAAKHWAGVSRAGGVALTVAGTVPSSLVTAPTRAARRLVGADTVPLWSDDLPKGGRPRRPRPNPGAVAVYFPACIGSMFGPAEDSEGVGPAFEALCQRAGVALSVPAGISKLCCGTPWKSKGLTPGYTEMQRRVLPVLWEATRHGELPVVCDAASCTEGLIELIAKADPAYAGLRVVDAVAFVDEHVLPALPAAKRLTSLALHPTCSSTRLGTNDALARVAAAVADEVVIPDGWGCCAFAGDRGLLHPELTASASAREATSVREREFSGYASTNRTCEIGMHRATGKNYRHLLEIVEQATENGSASMKQFAAEPVSDNYHELAEGPVWDAPRDRLLWVDVQGGQVFEGRFAGGAVVTTDRHDFDGTVGAVVAAADGRLLVATDVGLVEIDTDGTRRPVVGRLIPVGKNSRLNDGACDPAGRFLVGSLALDEREGAEVLYRLETDGTVTEVDSDLTLSNGLAWTADGTGFYSVDTIPGVVWYRTYEPDTGHLGTREELLRIADETPAAFPDGLCLDVDGNLWIAIWGAGQVRCFTPSGKQLAAVNVPAPHTSSVAFIGPNLDTLLITTARKELTAEQLATFPDSGRLFTARVGTRGLPTTPWQPHQADNHQSPFESTLTE